MLTFKRLPATLYSNWFNIQQFYYLATVCVNVLLMDLGTNSDYFHVRR
jgi:hypothetical protein